MHTVSLEFGWPRSLLRRISKTLSKEEQQELTREFDTNEHSSDEVPQDVVSETITGRRPGDDDENRDRLTG